MNSGKKIIIALVAAVAVIVVGYGLIMLASGSGYNLTVKDPSLGKADAPVLIEEFADFQCPACKTAATAVKEILKAYPNQVRLVYKDFPIPGHEHARTSAAAGLCAAQQDKFLPFYETVYAQQEEWAPLDAAGFDAYLQTMGRDEALQLDLTAFNDCRNSRDAKREVDLDASEGISRGVNSTPTFFINGEKKAEVLSVFQWITLINAELEKKGLQPENAAAKVETPTQP